MLYERSVRNAMEQLKKNFKKNALPRLAEALRGGWLHHAYIIEGEKEGVLKHLADFFEQDLGITLANNPDYWRVDFETFGVEEAHMLKERQSLLSAKSTDARKLFVICAGRFSVEAQNALLKVLEEPTAGTHIFFILPDASRVLPTVRSRVVFLRDNSAGAFSEKTANAFFAASWSEREKLIAAIAEEKNRAGAFLLLSGLEAALKEQLKRTGDIRKYQTSLSALHKCRTHLSGRAPSLKMLLEYVAAVLPMEELDA